MTDKNLKSVLRAIVRESAPELRVKFSDTTEYDHTHEIVYLAPHDFKEDLGFMRHLREVHKCKWADKINVVLWATMHEVGHYYTLDDCEEDDYEVRAACAMVSTEEAAASIAIQDRYYNLESEWAATEWAIQYIKKNKAKFIELSRKIEED